MKLGNIAEHCYNITSSYLSLPAHTPIISSTQKAIELTRQQLLNDTFNKWSPLNGDISFSYNGGKDCQVLVLLYLSCLWEFFLKTIHNSQYGESNHKFPLFELPTVFIDQEEGFSTIKSFVETTSSRYAMSLYESSRNEEGKTFNMTESFQNYLNIHPETEAIVIGIRHTDPFGESLTHIQKTDSGWPDFTRIQPILHWNLENIWSFLLYSGEPVCGLYGFGYTSLGGLHNTQPNPNLAIDEDNENTQCSFEWELSHSFGGNRMKCLIDDDDRTLIDAMTKKYHPGWYLTDDALERAGRIKKPKD